ncbi:hypothetical protein [Pseudomonas syringae pv. coryli]|uniref:hypothetical protein n=1 Tax=Pseudomonas syringae pv. coryli TaxID=317659 RepID=UPI003D29DDD0
MPEDKLQIPQDKMAALAANFFAAGIVLSQKNRATSQELDTAAKTYDSTYSFLLRGGYLPNEAFIKPIPEGPDGHLTIIIGPDGCIPLADRVHVYTVPGSVIQQVLSIYYESWFHSLKGS